MKSINYVSIFGRNTNTDSGPFPESFLLHKFLLNIING